MRGRFTRTKAKREQGGYALLVVVFLTALLVVASMSVGLRILTEGRRQKEQEMIWRGKQYTRAIKLYYRKFGRFPNSVDDLVKPKVGNVRMMRQPYTDPMNKEDGSWRLIYVGPAGQLIGSLKPQTGGPIALGPGQTPSTSPTGSGGTLSTSGGFGSGLGTSSGPSGFGAGASGASGASTGGTTTATGTTGTSTDAQPVPSGDTPTIVGGNIIGVGSKIDQNSILVYETATNYRLFEFIWNPAKDAGLVGVGGVAPAGAPAPGSTGSTGSTGAPPGPITPQLPPTAAPPNQNPPQQQ